MCHYFNIINGSRIPLCKVQYEIKKFSDISVTIISISPPLVNFILEQYYILLHKPNINSKTEIFANI